MLITGYSRVFAAAGGFTPADLFASGEDGVFYDISDLSTLWQDTGGTVQVTADGQSAARMDDLSGNGNNVTQGTASRRPAYKTDGTFHWLQVDGVDDFLTLSGAPVLAQPGTAAAAAKYDNLSGTEHIFDGISGRWTIFRGGTNARIYAGGSTSTYENGLDTDPHVHLAEFNGASSFGRYDGVQSGALNPGTGGLDGINVGTFGVGVGQFEGRIFSLIIIDRQLTGPETSDLEDWLADKSGVTL